MVVMPEEYWTLINGILEDHRDELDMREDVYLDDIRDDLLLFNPWMAEEQEQEAEVAKIPTEVEQELNLVQDRYYWHSEQGLLIQEHYELGKKVAMYGTTCKDWEFVEMHGIRIGKKYYSVLEYIEENIMEVEEIL